MTAVIRGAKKHMCSAVTVKFKPNSESQDSHCQAIDRVLHLLIEKKDIEKAEIEIVFPGSSNPNLSTLFVVKLVGEAAKAIERFKAMEGIDRVYLAPERHPA